MKLASVNRQSLKFTWRPVLLLLALCNLHGVWAGSPTATLTIDAAHSLHWVSPTLYGIFFEDINCSADGGLYAEQVRNRNFEDSSEPDYWEAVKTAVLSIDDTRPVSPKNPRALRIDAKSAEAGAANDGFWGIALNQGDTYTVSFLARCAEGMGPLTVALQGKDGKTYAKASTKPLQPDWTSYQFSLVPIKSDPEARLVITCAKPGTFWLDMVSLFPKKTWKGRANGLRTDLAGMLQGLTPAFVRFPGGCWVEGDTMNLAYRWKQTIGDLSERRTQYNLWQYYATHGLGFHEYLQMCEDLGAEPLFVINCGMSHKEVVPMDQMPEFVQDALDAIEYANGPVTTKWGAIRARNHHPKPFNLRFMEIGNENGGPRYEERYALFCDAIKARYPQMHLIANEWSGRPTKRPVEIVDEHYYSTPEFFIQNSTKYDTYDRAGRKVYVGEYAVTQGGGEGNLRAAVGEAAFMTGLERNSDVVVMASYAPLFANVHYKKWNPDLIDFDSSRVYGLPSYYVQQMFSRNRAEQVVNMKVSSPEVLASPRSGCIGVGTWRTSAEFKDLKVESDGRTLFSSDFASGTNGWRLHRGNWSTSEGTLRQTSLAENIRAFAGDKTWSNYTYTLKARKLAGEEGFLIPFLVKDEGAKAWWNIGGWGNTRHAIEMEGIVANDVPGKIESNRWYDIRIEVSPVRIKCYLDNRLIHDLPFPKTESLYAVAGLSAGRRELILKVVNVSRVPQDTDVKLVDALPRSTGKAIVLSSENAEDENSLEHPSKVVPRELKVELSGPEFQHVFPANSVTILRLPLR